MVTSGPFILSFLVSSCQNQLEIASFSKMGNGQKIQNTSPQPNQATDSGETPKDVRQSLDSPPNLTIPKSRMKPTTTKIQRKFAAKSKTSKTAGNGSDRNSDRKGWRIKKEDESLLKCSGNLITYSSQPGKPGPLVTAVWMTSGPVTVGEHYWTIECGDENGSKPTYSVGLWSAAEDQAGGIFLQNEDLTNGQPGSKALTKGYTYSGTYAEDKVGILISFNQPKVQLYFFKNGTPLGLAADIQALRFPSGVYPAVQFRGRGRATAKIQKEVKVPNVANRLPGENKSVVGSWLQVPHSFKFDLDQLEGQSLEVTKSPGSGSEPKLWAPLQSVSNLVRLDVSNFPKNPNQYKILMIVAETQKRHVISFKVEKVVTIWKGIVGQSPIITSNACCGAPAESVDETPRTVPKAPSTDIEKLQAGLANLLQNPEVVTVVDEKMTIVKGKSKAVFSQMPRPKRPFFGDPFRTKK